MGTKISRVKTKRQIALAPQALVAVFVVIVSSPARLRLLKLLLPPQSLWPSPSRRHSSLVLLSPPLLSTSDLLSAFELLARAQLIG
ncbi:hypothetical protein RchiOBHm_Chr3g0491921 [Rosa chinensis]|uniref:Uncharacterized protein n=1 Tax=Rosa chinensis TaxID=74649 RepID=A0A2P6RGD7_ROSCH|nr:hypothetical protein RchiOBHm_Chr3g0491921 [Rosa chinensis]